MLWSKRRCWWVLVILFGLCLLGPKSARADIQQAQDPIFDHRVGALLESVQEGGTDLPMSLLTRRDVYLFVTVGAAYTDVIALANPSVPASTLAQALAGASAGTSLSAQTVTWSSDDYSAARLFVHSHPGFRIRSTHSVPLGALIAGLRRSGYLPHCLLRVPVYATSVGLPPPCRPLTHYAWYDEAQVAPLKQVTVQAALTPVDVLIPLFFLFFMGAVGSVDLIIATRIAKDTRLPLEVRRRRFHAWVTYPIFGAIFLQVTAMLYCLQTTHPMALADLWFGSVSATTVVPFLVLGIAVMPVFLMISTRKQIKLLGATPGVFSKVPMSPEEKAVHQRMARWTSLPHGVAAVAFGAGIAFVPRHSTLYPMLHPALMVLLVTWAAIVPRFFRKPLSAFTRVTVDHDLTWRARQLGTQMGLRLQDVRIIDSAAASIAADITTERGGHFQVTRKLVEIMSPEEIDFLLTSQAARMQVKDNGAARAVLLALLPSFAPVALVAWLLSGHPALAFFNLMPIFIPVIFLCLMLPFFLQKKLARSGTGKALEADRKALEVVGNPAVAEAALVKMMQYPSGPAVAGVNSPLIVLGERLKAIQALKATSLPSRVPLRQG
jgi:hypothetical protein